MPVKQNMCFMNTIVYDVIKGQAIPAGMQRPYVWEESDVLALCDSIRSRFPIGGILTWSPPEGVLTQTVSKPRLGPIAPGDETPSRRLILDGQNRLATLAWIMCGHEPTADTSDASDSERRIWLSGRALYFDHAESDFIFLDPEAAEDRLCLPVKFVFTGRARTMLDSWKRWEAKGFTEDQIDLFMKAWQHVEEGFLEARIVETLIEGATPEEARHAFLRISRTGVPMSDEDFQAALDWLPQKS